MNSDKYKKLDKIMNFDYRYIQEYRKDSSLAVAAHSWDIFPSPKDSLVTGKGVGS